MQQLQIPETYDQAALEEALAALGITDIDRILRVVLKPDVLEVTVLIRREPERDVKV